VAGAKESIPLSPLSLSQVWQRGKAALATKLTLLPGQRPWLMATDENLKKGYRDFENDKHDNCNF
jgi:hypothetical protein